MIEKNSVSNIPLSNVKTIALAGNPNVGKSTLFNNLTGLKQHTGNWAGKTVSNAKGTFEDDKNQYTLVDIPGTYSLLAHSSEEEVARNYICFGGADAVVVVCDATCLERNMNLVLQISEISSNFTVCVNLMDEAKRKGIKIDIDKLSQKLGVPVVATTARKKKDALKLIEVINSMSVKTELFCKNPLSQNILVKYDEKIESKINILEQIVINVLQTYHTTSLPTRWLCLRLIENDPVFLNEINNYLGFNFVAEVRKLFGREFPDYANENSNSWDDGDASGTIALAITKTAEEICKDVVEFTNNQSNLLDRKIDRITTGKLTAFPCMAILLMVVFWLTISGANYPSQLLSDLFFKFEEPLYKFSNLLQLPTGICEAIVYGLYRVPALVVSVMLPPMAIFFPLFTILEDLGYLPRIAYNLDRPFKCCKACGKQALTMCMGFGCNASGVVGCRIIDSPRERLLAILTNCLVPCNGRFPTLIALITMFFVGTGSASGVGVAASGVGGAAPASGISPSLLSAAILTGIILLGIALTLGATRLLSATLLKGVPAAFTLELPPYRKPQVVRTLVRSFLDRTLTVLWRALAVAAPAGLIIWMLSNIQMGGSSLLAQAATLLDPIGRFFGMDGVILLAFILGFPANETVIPIMIMTYSASANIPLATDISLMREIFIANGWTWVTAACTILFSLAHWPCSTTLLTIKKETGSIKWTIVAFILPTCIGLLLCALVKNATLIIG